uniref:Uncharacterized protein n=1 Tax=Glossina palpalis gambiensis TaxID=67801 RepID=A0A1B0BV15_9MUSC
METPEILNDRCWLQTILIIKSSFNPSIYCQKLTRMTRIKSYIYVKINCSLFFHIFVTLITIQKNETTKKTKAANLKKEILMMTQTDIFNLMQILMFSFKKVRKPSSKTPNNS